MGSKYRLWLDADSEIDIEAERFEVNDAGVILFYKRAEPEDGVRLTDMSDTPFIAYTEWMSVLEV